MWEKPSLCYSITIKSLPRFPCGFCLQLNHLQRKLGIEQLSRHLGLHQRLSTDEKVALAKEYMRVYMNGLTLGLFIGIFILCL